MKHKEKNFKCLFYQFCKYQTSERAHIHQHLQRYLPAYTCDLCENSNKKFSLPAMRSHFNEHHPKKLEFYKSFITCDQERYEQFECIKNYVCDEGEPLSLPKKTLDELNHEFYKLKGKQGRKLTQSQKLRLENLAINFAENLPQPYNKETALNELSANSPQENNQPHIPHVEENSINKPYETNSTQQACLDVIPVDPIFVDFPFDPNIELAWYVNKAINNFPDIQPIK
jgi:hypothetical protein